MWTKRRYLKGLLFIIFINIFLKITFNTSLIDCFNIFQSHEEKVEEKMIEIQLQHCPCKRRILHQTSNGPRIHYNKTTCGLDAFKRGTGQKVVTFSFYGHIQWGKRYFDGIKANLELMPKYYPDWTMRLYFDAKPNDKLLEQLCLLACNSSILDLCKVGDLPGTPFEDASKIFAMIWRFIPTLDPQVDLYNCRDLDSRFSDREVAAVNEWISIGEPVHAMRDHSYHTVPMLGASWGAYLSKKNSRLLWQESWTKILADNLTFAERFSYGHDQTVLTRHVWEAWAENMSVQHDSYYCKNYRNFTTGIVLAFPTERRQETNNFVASRYLDNWILWEECPVECRRKPDWVHC